MFRTILAAVDGSEFSDQALDVAGSLAERYGSSLLLLLVVPEARDLERLRRIELADIGVERSAEEYMNLVVREIMRVAVERIQGLRLQEIRTDIRHGDAAETIVEFARSEGVDLIVLGSRGLADAESVPVGSVSAQVNQLAYCSCLIVK